MRGCIVLRFSVGRSAGVGAPGTGGLGPPGRERREPARPNGIVRAEGPPPGPRARDRPARTVARSAGPDAGPPSPGTAPGDRGPRPSVRPAAGRLRPHRFPEPRNGPAGPPSGDAAPARRRDRFRHGRPGDDGARSPLRSRALPGGDSVDSGAGDRRRDAAGNASAIDADRVIVPGKGSPPIPHRPKGVRDAWPAQHQGPGSGRAAGFGSPPGGPAGLPGAVPTRSRVRSGRRPPAGTRRGRARRATGAGRGRRAGAVVFRRRAASAVTASGREGCLASPTQGTRLRAERRDRLRRAAPRDYQAQSHLAPSSGIPRRKGDRDSRQRANIEKGGRPDSGRLDPAVPAFSSRAASICIAKRREGCLASPTLRDSAPGRAAGWTPSGRMDAAGRPRGTTRRSPASLRSSAAGETPGRCAAETGLGAPRLREDPEPAM